MSTPRLHTYNAPSILKHQLCNVQSFFRVFLTIYQSIEIRSPQPVKFNSDEFVTTEFYYEQRTSSQLPTKQRQTN